jgi:hypothetical protein
MFMQLLRRKSTVAEFEAEQLVDGIPFGYCNREWEALKAKVQPGDEVWFWSSDPEDWERFMGWEGIALVRNGEIIDSFITALN